MTPAATLLDRVTVKVAFKPSATLPLGPVMLSTAGVLGGLGGLGVLGGLGGLGAPSSVIVVVTVAVPSEVFPPPPNGLEMVTVKVSSLSSTASSVVSTVKV